MIECLCKMMLYERCMFSSLCLHVNIIILLTKIGIYTRFKDGWISLSQWQIRRVILQSKKCETVFFST